MNTQRIIIFGVSGCGKTTVGNLLAKKLALPFFDADDFHPPENIQKLTAGIPLADSDRKPWLNIINKKLMKSDGGFVLACSALKESYRSLLTQNMESVHWVLLHGSFELIHNRLNLRSGHFMNPDLLQDQFDTLEIPEYGIKCSIEYPPEVIVQKIMNRIIE